MLTAKTGRRSCRMFKKRNLVFLVVGQNACYTHVTNRCPEEVEANPAEGTWVFRGSTYLIGKTAGYLGVRGATIGVYDKTKLRHLQEIMSADRRNSDWFRPAGE